MKISLGAKPLALPTPAWLVGTYDADGKPNIATVAWCGVCCTDPPSVAVSLRKARYSYDAIVARKAFTVSVPSESFVRETDYAGIVSGRAADKFAVAGLTPVRPPRSLLSPAGGRPGFFLIFPFVPGHLSTFCGDFS